ncbi:hypothetical protein C0Q70_16190 [Pomacea canaliculata]|uniref:Uncharacterized protein n=1 Tax=Pomacea canaliculata TaxID=400727 RepID=A0A2T7NP28_POMCA|nr:hypothetical protein C0Q70_16190 [Pomacea canaliculata]
MKDGAVEDGANQSQEALRLLTRHTSVPRALAATERSPSARAMVCGTQATSCDEATSIHQHQPAGNPPPRHLPPQPPARGDYRPACGADVAIAANFLPLQSARGKAVKNVVEAKFRLLRL